MIGNIIFVKDSRKEKYYFYNMLLECVIPVTEPSGQNGMIVLSFNCYTLAGQFSLRSRNCKKEICQVALL